MVEKRYRPFGGHGFFLPLLPVFLSLFFSLDVPLSVAAATQSPPLINTAQEPIMKDLEGLTNAQSRGKWNTSNRNPCGWHGITCSSNGSVTGVTLSSLGLANSSIFTIICRLDTLQSLDLSRNFFADLPAQFFASSSCPIKEGLRSLNLSSNRLSSSLGGLSGFRQLQVLDLSFNYFVSRNLSSDLGAFSRLRSLNLSYNNFEGDVPISMVLSLEDLVLSGNRFRGVIPEGLFEYRNLTTLDLSQNILTGHVPDNFTKLVKLQTLILSGNNLSESIPKSLIEVTSLSRFSANQNSLTGTIPSGMTRHLRILDLSYNKLNGTIPSDLLSSPALVTIDLTSNRLTGEIPSNFSQKLYRIRLGDNSLNGSIPESIGDASRLAYLELDSNQLSGGITSQLSKCKDLALLNLASNNLQGSVPHEISSLTKLVVLKLQNNSLNGSIPRAFSLLSKLSILNLSRNLLTGDIPQNIVLLTNLSNLNLEGNRIGGTIPTSISLLASLIELNLGNNNLNGTIPPMPVSLSTALNLSHNYLSGSFPSNIGYLLELEILDLSYNNLSGPVPSSLASLQSLTQFMIAYNQFSGPVPALPHALVNTTGNPGITNTDGTDGSHISTGRLKKNHTVLIIVVALVSALLGLCLVVATVMFSSSKRIYRVEDVGQPMEQDLPEIIRARFITTNSIHTSAIEFMKAIEAVSNHSNIFLKTRFCTYYKAVMPNGSTYSVKKLNWGDKIFQIGSQEKFGYELEVLGKLSNSNVKVPLAYVLTVDSAYLVYEHVYKGTVFDFLHGGRSSVLDWPSRYSIALGVAQGLTFLHGCNQPVLLVDLSTRTIHLKCMNEPQIGDIELYRIIDPSKSTGSLSTIAGTIGYIPPEYAYTMRLTMPGNVYSFGVILLELLTGKPSVIDGIELAKWTLSLSANPDQRGQIFDTRVSRTSAAVHSQMSAVLNIALSCVAFSPDARPKMRNVLRQLFNAK